MECANASKLHRKSGFRAGFTFGIRPAGPLTNKRPGNSIITCLMQVTAHGVPDSVNARRNFLYRLIRPRGKQFLSFTITVALLIDRPRAGYQA
jgi:hypothetical protein